MNAHNFYPELTRRGPIVYSRYEQRLRVGERTRDTITVEVEELVRPVLRGASVRTHRLWQDGSLAGYGAWRHSLEDAVKQADYLIEVDRVAKLSMLEQRVQKLEATISALRAENEALKAGHPYTEVTYV